MKILIKNTYIIITAFAIISVLASCATIFTGTKQNIRIKSQPEGCSVFINGQNTYMSTPCKVRVNRRQKPSEYNNRNEIHIEVRKDGYKNANKKVVSTFNPIAGVSIVFIVPFLVDWASGAYLNYQKSNYLYLEPLLIEDLEPEIAQEKSGVQYYFKSDIDFDIPVKEETHWNRFALIIGNENYAAFQPDLSTNANVKYARNDALSFKEYAVNTLGIPDDNIMLTTDATLAQMKKDIAKLNLLAKNAYGKAELYFYYAGHGLPHEKTKDPYLLPVDVSGKNLEFAISLNEIFNKLTEYDTKKITCFLDCCFSGGARSSLPFETRGIKIIPKHADIIGNMVVFAASSADQSAMAYDEQKHGLFTYYLLKKFKESKGEVTYGNLEKYLKQKLPLQSILINEKEQVPQISIGHNIDDDWQNWKF